MNLEHLPQLPQDKANHLLYGCVAALLGALAAPYAGVDPRICMAAAAAAAGVAKEVWDKVSKLGDPNAADAIATACGAIPLVVGYSLAV